MSNPSKPKSEQRSVLVTGGTSGFGLEIAQRFQTDGYRVAVVGRNEPTPETRDLIGDALFVQGDLTDDEVPERVVAEVVEQFGKIDVLVNNAGRRHAGTILETPLSEIREVFDLNTFAAIAMTAATARHMAEHDGGSVINMLSRLAFSGVPTLSTYSASKGALDAYTRAAAVELAPHNIRVNAVSPGMARTPLIEDWLSEQSDPKQALADTVADIPLGRLATPQDVAGAVAYLASPDATYITGTSLSVDGGYLAH